MGPGSLKSHEFWQMSSVRGPALCSQDGCQVILPSGGSQIN